MLPKFTGFEDPCLFIPEFEEVCVLIYMPRVSIDVMRTKFISFALKDDVRSGCMVLRLVLLNLRTPLLISSLRGTSY